MKGTVLKKIYRIGAGWLLMLLVLCSLAIPFPSKATQIPDERLGPRLADQEELLTTEEQEELLARLDEISERQQCDVVIVTVVTAVFSFNVSFFISRSGYKNTCKTVILFSYRFLRSSYCKIWDASISDSNTVCDGPVMKR